MSKVTFRDALEMVDSLSLEEKESLIEIVNRRLIEDKRRILIDTVKESRKDYNTGNVRSGRVEDLIADLLDE